MGALSDIVFWTVLLLMAAATSVAVLTSYYFYRWRRVLTLEGKVAVIPEELIAHLERLRSKLGDVRDAVRGVGTEQKTHDANLLQYVKKINKTIEQLFETTVSLQTALDYRDTEIERLKQGYDAHLTRRFISRFLQVKLAIADAEASASADTDTLRQIGRLMDDALDECGVEEFRPKINEDYRTALGVADNPQIVQSHDQNQNFKIESVLESGFRLKTSGILTVIVPAKVRIYVNPARSE